MNACRDASNTKSVRQFIFVFKWTNESEHQFVCMNSKILLLPNKRRTPLQISNSSYLKCLQIFAFELLAIDSPALKCTEKHHYTIRNWHSVPKTICFFLCSPTAYWERVSCQLAVNVVRKTMNLKYYWLNSTVLWWQHLPSAKRISQRRTNFCNIWAIYCANVAIFLYCFVFCLLSTSAASVYLK